MKLVSRVNKRVSGQKEKQRVIQKKGIRDAKRGRHVQKLMRGSGWCRGWWKDGNKTGLLSLSTN